MHFQDQICRQLEELWIIAIGLKQEREDIKASFRRLPSLLNADLHNRILGINAHILFKLILPIQLLSSQQVNNELVSLPGSPMNLTGEY